MEHVGLQVAGDVPLQVSSFAQNASHAPVMSSAPPVLELAELLVAELLLADVESAVEPPALAVDAAPPAPPEPDVACDPPAPVADEAVARVVESPPLPPPVAQATTETTTKGARARMRMVPLTSQFSVLASTRRCDAARPPRALEPQRFTATHMRRVTTTVKGPKISPFGANWPAS